LWAKARGSSSLLGRTNILNFSIYLNDLVDVLKFRPPSEPPRITRCSGSVCCAMSSWAGCRIDQDSRHPWRNSSKKLPSIDVCWEIDAAVSWLGIDLRKWLGIARGRGNPSTACMKCIPKRAFVCPRRDVNTALAKVGIEGSNPFARSKSLDLNNLLI
jgi:hypothetical protein